MTPPTEAFLSELRDRIKAYGWDGDLYELTAFLRNLYEQAGYDKTFEELFRDIDPYASERPERHQGQP